MTGAPRALNPFLHSVLLLFLPQVRGLSEGMLEKLDLEDEGKRFVNLNLNVLCCL